MLILIKNSYVYFSEELKKAMSDQKIALSESTEAYIVYLLNDFLRSDRIYAGVDYGEKINMADMLQRALEAENREALRIFRHLGDTSLYLSGFFKGFAKKTLVSRSYYLDMGALAYAQAGSLSRVYAAGNAATFQELSEQFISIAEVIKIIAKNSK